MPKMIEISQLVWKISRGQSFGDKMFIQQITIYENFITYVLQYS